MIKKLIVLAILVLFVHPAQASKRDPEESQELPSAAKRSVVQPPRPVNAECMKDTATNQKRATEYIVGLMHNSKSGERPTLIENQTCDSDIAYNEVKVILDRAERMAQSGMASKITEPDFRFNGSE
jgi:hypothetical protein